MNVKLAGYRKMLRLTQKDMADRLGISRMSYYKKENGINDFTQSEMFSIMALLREHIKDVTMDEIFFDKGIGKLSTAL